MSTTTFCIAAAIVFYLLGMLAIGFLLSKNNNSSEDFYLGGRKMGPLVTAMSAEASDMSSWLLMGLPGVAYLTGLADPFWTAAGLAAGTYLNWLLIARRLRRYSEKLGAITVPDFFSRRYHDDSKALNAIAALVIIIFFIPYTASGFAACGKLWNSLFGVDYMTAMVLSALVIVAYTIMGGFMAVSTTDLIQSVVMTLALISVLGYGFSTAGGWQAVMDHARSLPGYLSLTQSYNASTGTASAYGPITVISTLAWGLGYFGMPHILLRFMAIRDEKKLILSRRIASIWVVIAMSVGILIGIVCLGMTSAGVLPVLEGTASETAIVQVAGLIAEHNILTALLAGVILAGVLAATMSTADSQMLVAASSVSQNILQDFLHIRLNEKQGLRAARLTILAISAVAVFLARDPNSSVFGIVSFAWAGFGGAFGPAVLCALFWKRSTRTGALAGMVSGGAVIFLWKYLVRPLGGIWNIYELLPAFLVSLAVIIIVSLLTPRPCREIEEEFDAVR